MRCSLCNSVSDMQMVSETSNYFVGKYHEEHGPKPGLMCDECFSVVDEVMSEYDQDNEVDPDEEFYENVVGDYIDNMFDPNVIVLDVKEKKCAK